MRAAPNYTHRQTCTHAHSSQLSWNIFFYFTFICFIHLFVWHVHMYWYNSFSPATESVFIRINKNKICVFLTRMLLWICFCKFYFYFQLSFALIHSFGIYFVFVARQPSRILLEFRPVRSKWLRLWAWNTFTTLGSVNVVAGVYMYPKIKINNKIWF